MLVTPSWADLCAGERARLGYFRLREGDPGGVVARRSPLSMERLSPSGRGVPSRDPPNPLFCRGQRKKVMYLFIQKGPYIVRACTYNVNEHYKTETRMTLSHVSMEILGITWQAALYL